MHRSRAIANKYKAGKVFHIYRPKATDADGKEIWADLDIDEAKGTLTVTIDQSWLDSASYPVVIDPTFGYETIGGSQTSYAADWMRGSWFTAPEDGTAESLTAYFDPRDSTYKYKAAIYEKTDSDGDLLGGTEELTNLTAADWHTFSLLSSQSITDGVDYIFMLWGDSALYFNYDAVTDKGFYKSVAYDSWPDPLNPGGTTDAKHSIYCTYTVALKGWCALEFETEPPSPGWNKILYVTEPPSPGWNKISYK